MAPARVHGDSDGWVRSRRRRRLRAELCRLQAAAMATDAPRATATGTSGPEATTPNRRCRPAAPEAPGTPRPTTPNRQVRTARSLERLQRTPCQGRRRAAPGPGHAPRSGRPHVRLGNTARDSRRTHSPAHDLDESRLSGEIRAPPRGRPMRSRPLTSPSQVIRQVVPQNRRGPPAQELGPALAGSARLACGTGCRGPQTRQGADR